MNDMVALNRETTLGGLAARYPALIPWFFARDWDFCCGGNRTLAALAADFPGGEAALIATIGAHIDRLPTDSPLPAFPERRPSDMIPFILTRFHEPHRQLFPALRRMTEKVAQVHGDRHPWLAELRQVVARLCDDLCDHMLREEQVLFPMILHQGSERAAEFGCSDGNPTLPMQVMRMEHEEAAALLARLIELTSRFTPPEDACTTFQACYRALAELDRELRLHMHLENNLLFPAVAAAQAEQAS